MLTLSAVMKVELKLRYLTYIQVIYTINTSMTVEATILKHNLQKTNSHIKRLTAMCGLYKKVLVTKRHLHALKKKEKPASHFVNRYLHISFS